MVQSIRIVAVVLLIPLGAHARWISFGIRGGIPLSRQLYSISDPTRPDLSRPIINYVNYSSRTLPYTVGPTVEFQLPLRLSVEVDALYMHLKYTRSTVQATPSGGLHTNDAVVAADRWEFPLLLKYRVPVRFAVPYGLVGGTINRVSNVDYTQFFANKSVTIREISYSELQGGTPFELIRRNAGGLVIGGGFQFPFAVVSISPEIRYTRWNSENFRTDYYNYLRSNRNHVEFLLGITF